MRLAPDVGVHCTSSSGRKGDFDVRARVLGVGFLAGIFVLVAAGAVANAITMTTAPEIEPFTLTTAQPVTFEVSNDGTPPATVTTNSPQIASQALTFNQFDAGLGSLTATCANRRATASRGFAGRETLGPRRA
jgi:hypothetical protein